MTPASLEELVSQGRIEEVDPDPPAAQAMLDEAKQHLASAAGIAAFDPNGAYALLYDAARKAVTAQMLASGYRARNRPGAHEAVVRYAEASLAGDPRGRDIDEFDRMRRTRNRSEYWVRPFGQAEIEADLAHARGIVAAADAHWPGRERGS